MLFNANVNVVSIDINENDDNKTLSVVLVLGMMLPIAAENGQPIVNPSGTIRFMLDKSNSEQVIKRLTEVSETLSDAPQVEVASNLEGVEKAAQMMESFKK